MEVTRHFIGIFLIATLLVALSTSELIVQPGYSHQTYYGTQDHTVAPMSHSSVTHQPSSRSLADEFQRNQILQRMIENQIRQMEHERQSQQFRQVTPGGYGQFPVVYEEVPPGMVGLPLIHYPLIPRIGGGKLYSLTPSGIRGLHAGHYGLTRRPVLLGEAYHPNMPATYAVKSQWRRSASDESRVDSGDESEVQDVSSESSVDDDSVNRVDDLPVPQVLAADDSADKLVEPRHTGQSDDAIVGSPLDRIHYDQPHNYDQHHPMDSPGMSSPFMKTANAIGQMIDTVVPGIMDSRPGYENKDSISSMTHHQDPARNYQQHSQYHQPSSHQGERSESPSNWHEPSTSSNDQPMTGQSHNNQQPQNSEWSSMSSAHSSQNPSAKASDNNRYFQQELPATNTPINNWVAAARQTLFGYPVHQNYNTPGYNSPQNSYNNYKPGYNNYQPNYQSYLNRPQTGGYRPNGQPSYNYEPSQPIGPSSTATATASASSSANNYNNYSPYQRSTYHNPYQVNSQNGFSRAVTAVDQFGRAILTQLPQAVNSFIYNPNTMDYLRNIGRQTSQMSNGPYSY